MNDQNNISNEEDDPLDRTPGFGGAGNVNPFSVPDGYFETLPGRIHQRHQLVEVYQRFNRGAFVNLKPALAAIIVVLFVVASWLTADHYRKPSGVNDQEIAGYLQNEARSDFLDGGDDSIIYSLSAGKNSASSVIPCDSKFTREEVIDYLLTENIDLETITQQ